MSTSSDLYKRYQELMTEYGNPSTYWPQWCALEKNTEEREKIVIGMILVQRTTWHNANIALKNLKTAGLLSLNKLAELESPEHLSQIIRSAGFFSVKPQRLADMSKFVVQNGGIENLMKQDHKALREKLLEIKGVGKETADTILLYALSQPNFIIDEYTKRWVKTKGLTEIEKYDDLQQWFQTRLKPDVEVYQNLHALIIISQRGREKGRMEVV